MTLLKFLKTKIYPEILMYRSLHGNEAGRASYARPTQNSDTFSVKFSVFQNFTKAAVFNIKFPNLPHLLTFTCSLHFWHLQSANIKFSIYSRSVSRIYGVLHNTRFLEKGSKSPDPLKGLRTSRITQSCAFPHPLPDQKCSAGPFFLICK